MRLGSKYKRTPVHASMPTKQEFHTNMLCVPAEKIPPNLPPENSAFLNPSGTQKCQTAGDMLVTRRIILLQWFIVIPTVRPKSHDKRPRWDRIPRAAIREVSDLVVDKICYCWWATRDDRYFKRSDMGSPMQPVAALNGLIKSKKWVNFIKFHPYRWS